MSNMIGRATTRIPRRLPRPDWDAVWRYSVVVLLLLCAAAFMLVVNLVFETVWAAILTFVVGGVLISAAAFIGVGERRRR